MSDPSSSTFCLIPRERTGTFSLTIQIINCIFTIALVLLLILHIGRGYFFHESRPISFRNYSQVTISNNEMLNNTNTTSDEIEDNSDNTIMHLDTFSLDLDLIELLRTSTAVYIGIIILWILSMTMLFASIKFESLDLIIANSVVLCVQMLYSIIYALFTAILLFHYKNACLRTWIITSLIVFGLLLTSALCALALAMNTGWHKYVMNGDTDEAYF